MAETIPEHITALAASPSRDNTQDYDAQYDDNEYPFAQGVLNGNKCCSKCGATKTPQWREGPFGEHCSPAPHPPSPALPRPAQPSPPV